MAGLVPAISIISTVPYQVGCPGQAGQDAHGALAIVLHIGGRPASVSGGFGFGGMSGGTGCNVDSLNQ
jgi:hypothetical protein